MDPLALDIAHLFAGGLVLVGFLLLYQDRMTGLINIFALHALVVSLSVAWQATIQQAHHLYITAAIALIVKAVVIPVARRALSVNPLSGAFMSPKIESPKKRNPAKGEQNQQDRRVKRHVGALVLHSF